VFAATKKDARSRVALARAVLRDERGLKATRLRAYHWLRH